MPLAVTAVLSDILIAAALCYLLHNKRTGFRSFVILLGLNAWVLTSAQNQHVTELPHHLRD